MSRAGLGFINSILQEMAGVLASFPDILIYGIGVLGIVFAATAVLASNRTARNNPAPTTSRPTSSQSTTSSSSHTESSSGSNSTEETVTRDQSPDTPPEETAASTPSATDPETRSTQPTLPLSRNRLGVNSAVNEKLGREPVALAKTRTANRNDTPSSQQRSTSNSADSPTLATQLQRHFIDPIQVETGIDPISWDSSWGLIKADFSLTGVSADSGGELVYVNAFPSPVSAKSFDSPIEITTTSLIRDLLGTAASSSSPDQQSTLRHATVSTQRWHYEHSSDQSKTEPRGRRHLQGESLEDPSQFGFPSFTEESPDAGPRPSPPIQDADPHSTTQADTQKSRSPETTGAHSRPRATWRSHRENPVTDEALTVEVPFSNLDGSMPETATTQAPLEIPTERQAFDPIFDTEPSPRENETPLQNGQQPPQPTKPLVDRPMQTEMHQQIGLPRQPKSDKHRPSEATLDTALWEDDSVAPIEDLTHGLEAIGLDSTHFGSNALNRNQDSWLETEPPDPISDPFGVSETVNHFNETELFPKVNIDDPMPQMQDDLEDLQEPLFETEVRF